VYPQDDDNRTASPEQLSGPESGVESAENQKPHQDVVKDDAGNLYRIEGNKKIGPLEIRQTPTPEDPNVVVLEVQNENGDWVEANILPYSAENFEGGTIYGELELGDNDSPTNASNPEHISESARSLASVETAEGENSPEASTVGGALLSYGTAISSEIKDLSPDEVENQEASTDEYQRKMLGALDNIQYKMRLGQQALSGLLVGSEKEALAGVQSGVLGSIEQQITEATNKEELEDLERKFFQGSGDTDTENIAAGMAVDPSLKGFNLALGRANSIPAFMELANSIAAGREQLKQAALAAEQSGDAAAAHEAYDQVAEALGADDAETVKEFLHPEEAEPSDEQSGEV
jgi:hypothetical protein